jgi:hypothetical protein
VGEGDEGLTGEITAEGLGVQTIALPLLSKRSNGAIDYKLANR